MKGEGEKVEYKDGGVVSEQHCCVHQQQLHMEYLSHALLRKAGATDEMLTRQYCVLSDLGRKSVYCNIKRRLICVFAFHLVLS